MSWPSPPLDQLGPTLRGIARQWQAMFGAEFPALLRTVSVAGPGASWPLAMIRARAIAADDARARAVLDGFDAELAAALGAEAPRWPRRLRHAPVPLAPVETPALDPSQLLMLGAAPTSVPTREQAALLPLLAAAFGPRDESPRSAELRARVCTLAIPTAARERWRAGFGLMPPDAAVPGEHHGAMRLLEAALPDDRDVVAVDVAACEPMRPEAALDILLAGLTVRAALRRVGAGRDLDATRIERVAA